MSFDYMRMFYKNPQQFRRSGYTSGHAALILSILNEARPKDNKHDFSWLSLATLSERCWVSETHLSRMIRRLEDDGILEVKRRTNKTNWIRVIWPKSSITASDVNMTEPTLNMREAAELGIPPQSPVEECQPQVVPSQSEVAPSQREVEASQREVERTYNKPINDPVKESITNANNREDGLKLKGIGFPSGMQTEEVQSTFSSSDITTDLELLTEAEDLLKRFKTLLPKAEAKLEDMFALVTQVENPYEVRIVLDWAVLGLHGHNKCYLPALRDQGTAYFFERYQKICDTRVKFYANRGAPPSPAKSNRYIKILALSKQRSQTNEG
jgi:hypothetical protein